MNQDTKKECMTQALIQLIGIAKMQIQFMDYEPEQWTVPIIIRMTDIVSAMRDSSVKNIKIIIEP